MVAIQVILPDVTLINLLPITVVAVALSCKHSTLFPFKVGLKVILRCDVKQLFCTETLCPEISPLLQVPVAPPEEN